MKKIIGSLLFAYVTLLSAETIVIRQPGLVESLGTTVVGLARGVTEFATGAVCGSTTVINTTTPGVVTSAAPVVISQPMYPGIHAPVVTAPVVQPVVVPVATVTYPTVVTPVYHQPLYYRCGYCPRPTCGPHGYPYWYHCRRW